MQLYRSVQAEPFEGFTLFDELELDDPQGEFGRGSAVRAFGRRPSARSFPAPPRRRPPGRQSSQSAQRGGTRSALSRRQRDRIRRARRQRGRIKLPTDPRPWPPRRPLPPLWWGYPILDGRLPNEPTTGGSEQGRWVQHSLSQVLGLQLPVNGVMGPETRNAIRTFQQQKGLPVDGILGPPTERALVEALSGQADQAGAVPADQAEPAPTDQPAQSPAQHGAADAAASSPPEGELGSTSSSTLANLYGVPMTVLSALGRGLEPLAIRLAVLWGQRDENKLANLVFFARHPERAGRALVRGEPNFDRLSQEWLDIRQRLVRPALASAPRPQPASPTPGSTSIGFRPISVESPGGGRIRDKTPPQPADLETVSGYGGKRISLHRLAASAWRALVSAARADGIAGPLLLPTSGYRSPETQETLWQNALKKYGSPEAARKWVAPPGSSAHQTGRAIDLYVGGKNSSSEVAHLRTLPAYKWLVAHAERFGFYPYAQEPWHWEYNPPAAAQREFVEALAELPWSWQEYEDEGSEGMFGQEQESLDLESMTEFDHEVSRTSSAYIQWVQRSLNHILGTRLVEDGINGTLTRSAVRSFQQRHGLAVDGIVGPQTEGALIAAGATSPPGSTPSWGTPSGAVPIDLTKYATQYTFGNYVYTGRRAQVLHHLKAQFGANASTYPTHSVCPTCSADLWAPGALWNKDNTGMKSMNDLAEYIRANVASLGIEYVIWIQRISHGGAWRQMEDRESLSANHRDHIHITFKNSFH